jgi:hypothetical protein
MGAIIMKIRFHHYIARAYRRARVYKRLVRDEVRYGRVELGWRKRMGYLFKGFNSDKSYLYDLEQYPLDSYWSDIEENKVRAFNLVHSLLLDRKDIFHVQMAKLGAGPPVVGTLVNGRFYPYPPGEERSFEALVDSLPEDTLVRPLLGTGFGKTLRWLHMGERGLELGRSRADREAIPARQALSSGWWQIMGPAGISKASYAERLLPGRKNLLRITTLRCPESGAVFPAFAIQVIGEDSPLYAQVDLESGVLGQGVRLLRGKSRKECHACQPDNGARINGVVVDQWPQPLELAIRVHDALPTLAAVSWQMALSGQGWQIVNATNRLDAESVQFHGPLFKNDRFKEFVSAAAS